MPSLFNINQATICHQPSERQRCWPLRKASARQALLHVGATCWGHGKCLEVVHGVTEAGTALRPWISHVFKTTYFLNMPWHDIPWYSTIDGKHKLNYSANQDRFINEYTVNPWAGSLKWSKHAVEKQCWNCSMSTWEQYLDASPLKLKIRLFHSEISPSTSTDAALTSNPSLSGPMGNPQNPKKNIGYGLPCFLLEKNRGLRWSLHWSILVPSSSN